MPRPAPLVLSACLLGLILSCYGPVLFQNEQFAYRDAAHFYYPLYQRVQQEWAKGRLPVWETEENAGMPLLGNPTAAVLYPGKLIFAVTPSYAWGVRLYTIAHTALAVAGMFLLMRTWGASVTGSGISAIAYAFGMPVLFQYCNIIFLVGAAWLPLGLRAADRWLRQARPWALGELAVVLAMQTLGGDPETAYLLGMASAAYALGLWWSRGNRPTLSTRSRFLIWTSVAAAWVVLTLLAAAVFPRFRTIAKPPLDLPWTPWITAFLPTAWALVGFLTVAHWFGGNGRARRTWALAGTFGIALMTATRPVAWLMIDHGTLAYWLDWIRGFRLLGALLVLIASTLLWHRRDRIDPPAKALGGLVGAGILAALLTSAQLLPVLEFTSLTSRKAESGPHDVFPFSIEPTRLMELAFPGIYGSSYGRNTYWFSLIGPSHRVEVWTPSLYVGGLTFVLALAAWGVRDGSPPRAWLSVLALVSGLAALGKFASPLWLARAYLGAEPWLGSLDPATLRLDGTLHDGDGSPYGLMAMFLPGFDEFRYPSKLFTFTSLALCGLAALGWDQVTQAVGRARVRASRSAAFLGLIGLIALTGVVLARSAIVARFSDSSLADQGGAFGPIQPEATWREIAQSLGQGTLVMALSLAVLRIAPRRPRLASVLALVLLSLDLGLQAAPQVLTVPQSFFETPPELLRQIEAAERQNPTPGGYYRVHRLPFWEKVGWFQTSDPARYQDLVRWERRTLQPKYGIPLGLEYTLVEGTAELYDYMFFFSPFEGIHDARVARDFTNDPKARLVTHPRRGFDLWNSRYFILPYVASNDERRSNYAFLAETELITPRFPETTDQKARNHWAETEDWQIRRNLDAFPRAWVVHDATIRPPITGLNRRDRAALMEDITYKNDPTWSVRNKAVYDPRKLAWIEVEDPNEVYPFLSRTTTLPSEAPRITRYETQRVEIEVDLRTPGLVILADVFYPGWRLTVDGRDAPIYRANRLMRGAALTAGPHRLVYTYEPLSVRIGLALSTAGLLALLALGLWSWRRGNGLTDQGTGT